MTVPPTVYSPNAVSDTGRTLATRLIGDGAPAYVFLHGLFGQGKNWTSIATSLLPEASLLVDLPNHGDSSWTQNFSYVGMATSVIDVMDRLPNPVCLVGHSMGGKVAMIVALTRPDLVSCLVIEDIAPQDQPIDDVRTYAKVMQSIPIATLRTRHDARVQLSEHIHDRTMVGFLLQNLQQDPHLGLRWKMNLDVLARDIDLIGGWPDVHGVYHGPTLWITGGRSQMTATVPTQSMTRYFPHLMHVTIDNAGHWVHADALQDFVRAVSEFRGRTLTA